jgi:hypothetical protein
MLRFGKPPGKGSFSWRTLEKGAISHDLPMSPVMPSGWSFDVVSSLWLRGMRRGHWRRGDACIQGASEYVQYHAAATLLDRAGYGQLDQPAQQQALIVNINLGADSPPGDDRVLGSALPKGPICGQPMEGDQAGGGG